MEFWRIKKNYNYKKKVHVFGKKIFLVLSFQSSNVVPVNSPLYPSYITERWCHIAFHNDSDTPVSPFCRMYFGQCNMVKKSSLHWKVLCINEITECSRGVDEHEMNFQPDLESMRLALPNRSPGSDYMCLSVWHSRRGCKCGFEANKTILKTTSTFTNNSLGEWKQKEAVIKTGKNKRVATRRTPEKMPSIKSLVD